MGGNKKISYIEVDMSIEIINLRNEKPSKIYDVRVDRQSIFGNPFKMSKESKRDEVCDKYKIYFYEELKKKGQLYFFLQSLIKLYLTHGKLRLFCWCAPKRCHTETIVEFIMEYNHSVIANEIEEIFGLGPHDRVKFYIDSIIKGDNNG